MNHSHSSLSSWRRCGFQFYLKYKVGIPSKPSLGQARGSAGHKALEVYYRGERDISLALEAAHEEYAKHEVGTEDDLQLLINVLERYFEWAHEEDDFEVLHTELKFEIDFDGHPFVGIIDGVVKRRSQVWIMEHKFNKRVSTKHLSYDPQVSNYMIAGILENLNPIGVIYNIIRVSNGPTALKEPCVRKYVFRNKEGLSHFAEEMIKQMIEVEDFIENREDIPYRNLTPDCSWQCQFLPICMELNDTGYADHLIEKAMEEKNG